MSRRINEAAVRRGIVEHLYSQGFTERDSDGSDFQRGADTTLRFKVGTVYGEVTITVWKNERQIKGPIRVLTDRGLAEAMRIVDEIIEASEVKR